MKRGRRDRAGAKVLTGRLMYAARVLPIEYRRAFRKYLAGLVDTTPPRLRWRERLPRARAAQQLDFKL